MLKKLWFKLCLTIFLALTLSGCGAIRSVGNAISNSFSGFKIQFPAIHFP